MSSMSKQSQVISCWSIVKMRCQLRVASFQKKTEKIRKILQIRQIRTSGFVNLATL